MLDVPPFVRYDPLGFAFTKMNQNQNPADYAAVDTSQYFFSLIDAVKNKSYGDQIMIPLMDELLKRGMYREFFQMIALRIELERQQKEERKRRDIEARNKRASRSFLHTIILILVSSFLFRLYQPFMSESMLSAVCGLAIFAVFLIGVGSLIMMIFNALLRAGR